MSKVKYYDMAVGIAVDWSGQNLYWTDAAAQRLEVSRLDGSSRRSLVWQGLKKPKAIALDPRKGYVVLLFPFITFAYLRNGYNFFMTILMNFLLLVVS